MKLQAVVEAVQALAQRVLPVPVILEHLVRPLLGALGTGPDATVALIHVAADLGGALAARHVLPPLLELLNGVTADSADDASAVRAAGTPQHLSCWDLRIWTANLDSKCQNLHVVVDRDKATYSITYAL